MFIKVLYLDNDLATKFIKNKPIKPEFDVSFTLTQAIEMMKFEN